MLVLLNLSFQVQKGLFKLFVLLGLLFDSSSQLLDFPLVVFFLGLVLHDNVVAAVSCHLLEFSN